MTTDKNLNMHKKNKKTIIISEEQIKKVRQGLIAYENAKPDYEIGYEKPTDMSAFAHVLPSAKPLNESNDGYTTLYHGLRDYNLIHVISNGEITPNIPAEMGPKEIWLTNKPYGYSCLISLQIPNDEIGEPSEGKRFKTMNSRDYTTSTPIKLSDYEYKIEKCSGIQLTDEKIERWRELYTHNDKKSLKIIQALMDEFGDLWYYVILPMITDEETLIEEGKSNKNLITEENRTQKKKCVEYITNNVPAMVRSELNKPIDQISSCLKQMVQQAEGLYYAVANNQNGSNKLIDFFRINLYSHFGIGRNTILVSFIPGIARIACEELNFYAMDMSVRGGDILKFVQFLKLLRTQTEFMINDIEIDSNFNGMSFEDLMDEFLPKIEEYKNDIRQTLSNDEKLLTSDEYYDIIAIPDYVRSQYHGMGGQLTPTPEGASILRRLGDYCNWCVCGSNYGEYEYAQYLSNGGKMYVCLRRGYEDIPKEVGENCPLDEYGLSMINVIIGSDGLPDNITTRWNHENDGENNQNLWNAAQLQKILNVNYKETFKPRDKEELKQLRLSESKQNVIENVEPKDVDLSSFEIKQKLNPKFWKNEKLDSRIRLKLLDLADNFIDSLKIKNIKIDDIVMTGSLAGYTWNEKYSDIDVHILLDFNEIDKDKEFLTDYFKAKKDEWNAKHEELKIFNFPVEVYVQDINEHHISNSVYSLEENEWVTKPNKSKLTKEKFDSKEVQEKVSEFMNKIDELQENLDSAEIDSDLDDIYNKACKLFDDIKAIRSDSMKQKNANELSNGNIIFKTLRRNDYIEKLIAIKDDSYNKCNSLS